eukprot:Ihof_evm5s203 gene=Ihof_evmTU5s203
MIGTNVDTRHAQTKSVNMDSTTDKVVPRLKKCNTEPMRKCNAEPTQDTPLEENLWLFTLLEFTKEVESATLDLSHALSLPSLPETVAIVESKQKALNIAKTRLQEHILKGKTVLTPTLMAPLIATSKPPPKPKRRVNGVKPANPAPAYHSTKLQHISEPLYINHSYALANAKPVTDVNDFFNATAPVRTAVPMTTNTGAYGHKFIEDFYSNPSTHRPTSMDEDKYDELICDNNKDDVKHNDLYETMYYNKQSHTPSAYNSNTDADKHELIYEDLEPVYECIDDIANKHKTRGGRPLDEEIISDEEYNSLTLKELSLNSTTTSRSDSSCVSKSMAIAGGANMVMHKISDFGTPRGSISHETVSKDNRLSNENMQTLASSCPSSIMAPALHQHKTLERADQLKPHERLSTSSIASSQSCPMTPSASMVDPFFAKSLPNSPSSFVRRKTSTKNESTDISNVLQSSRNYSPSPLAFTSDTLHNTESCQSINSNYIQSQNDIGVNRSLPNVPKTTSNFDDEAAYDSLEKYTDTEVKIKGNTGLYKTLLNTKAKTIHEKINQEVGVEAFVIGNGGAGGSVRMRRKMNKLIAKD